MHKTNLRRTACLLVAVFLFAGAFVILRLPAGSVPGPAAQAKEQGKGERKCTERSAKGTYGFGLVGSFAAIGPVATSGTTTFDGEGHDFGKFSVTTFGSVQEFSFTGVYTVNSNCTGTATLNISPSVFGYSVLHFNAVGTDDQNEIKWLITDPGIVIAGTLTKQ